MKFVAAQLTFLLPTVLANIITIGNEIHSDLHRSQCSPVTEDTISDCLKPILNYANTIQKTSTNGSPFLQGAEIFKQLCSLYSEFKQCTNGITCHSISLEAVDASYGYMCGSGQKLFEKHAKCFAEIEGDQNYASCRNAAGTSMDDAVREKSKNDLDTYFQRLCRIMDDYLRCCRPFVIEKCGSDAWRLVSQITIDSLRVTMPHCELNNVLT
ncbi:hypothetical protein M3Y97_00239600 [Aphelenchoides bicaudatus]|nr:hypothetical protein M3Y97_00239600 [Aphelenchoides bicaudatus]